MIWWCDDMMIWWYDDMMIWTQEMFCLEHRKCFVWNAGLVVRGTEKMFCLEHRKCLAWNTRIAPAHHHHPWITLNHESDLSQLARSLSTLNPSMNQAIRHVLIWRQFLLQRNLIASKQIGATPLGATLIPATAMHLMPRRVITSLVHSSTAMPPVATRTRTRQRRVQPTQLGMLNAQGPQKLQWHPELQWLFVNL